MNDLGETRNLAVQFACHHQFFFKGEVMRNLVLFTLCCSALLLNSRARATGEDTVAEKQPIANSTPQMIAVEVKLIEVSDNKYEKLGVEFNTFNGQQSQKADGLMAFQHMSSAASIGFVEALVKNRLGRVIAEPRIAAISGREACLSIGLQSEAAESDAGAKEQVGIDLRITPTLLSDNKVQVDLNLKYSWQEQIKEESESDNQLRHFSLDTSIISKSCESSLLSGLEFKNYSDGRMLLIVTPELIEGTVSAPQAATQ